MTWEAWYTLGVIVLIMIALVRNWAGPDTVIGDGTWIDNLVQIGHNVRVGRGCVIVSQVGISGSTVIEDYVVLAGQVGIAGHLRIGKGARVKNCVIMQDSVIEEGAELENCILDKQAHVKAGGKLIGPPSYPIVISKNMTI